MSENITLEEIQNIAEAKAIELSAQFKTKVTELIFSKGDEFIVGYLKQPNRQTVRVAYDRLEKYGKLDAGDLLLGCCLVKEESDTRITNPLPEFDSIYNWACLEAFKLIEFSVSLSKKNMSLLESTTNQVI